MMMNSGTAAQTVSQFPQGHTWCLYVSGMYVLSVLKAFWHLSNFCPCEQKDKRTKKQNKTGLSRMFNWGLCSNMQRASSVFKRFLITFHDHRHSWIINKNFSQNQRIIFTFHKNLLSRTMTLSCRVIYATHTFTSCIVSAGYETGCNSQRI